MIGIFYIATGVYKQFFKEFLDSLDNLFVNEKIELVVISDGLNEWDDVVRNNVHITTEFFIDYPYSTINVNKFQIVYEYARKNNIDKIIYFDAETKIIQHDNSIDKDIINKVDNDKLVLAYSPRVTANDSVHQFWWGFDNCTPYGYYHGYKDFSIISRNMLDYVQKGWIRTSFFGCNINVLKDISERIKSLVNYNNCTMHLPLMLSDETWINYLYMYDKNNNFEVSAYLNYLDVTYDNGICIQKWHTPEKKKFIKHGTNNKFKCFVLKLDDDITTMERIHSFIIKNHQKLMIGSYGIENTYDTPYVRAYYDNDCIFYTNIYLWRTWFTGDSNVLLHPDFYRNYVNYNELETKCIALVNKINKTTLNFDYDKFFNEDYDYIENRSFNDLNDHNFGSIDFVIFSRKYIDAWLNNDHTFVPKVYII